LPHTYWIRSSIRVFLTSWNLLPMSRDNIFVTIASAHTNPPPAGGVVFSLISYFRSLSAEDSLGTTCSTISIRQQYFGNLHVPNCSETQCSPCLETLGSTPRSSSMLLNASVSSSSFALPGIQIGQYRLCSVKLSY
jgi:hypothetical protein